MVLFDAVNTLHDDRAYYANDYPIAPLPVGVDAIRWNEIVSTCYQDGSTVTRLAAMQGKGYQQDLAAALKIDDAGQDLTYDLEGIDEFQAEPCNGILKLMGIEIVKEAAGQVKLTTPPWQRLVGVAAAIRKATGYCLEPVVYDAGYYAASDLGSALEQDQFPVSSKLPLKAHDIVGHLPVYMLLPQSAVGLVAEHLKQPANADEDDEKNPIRVLDLRLSLNIGDCTTVSGEINQLLSKSGSLTSDSRGSLDNIVAEALNISDRGQITLEANKLFERAKTIISVLASDRFSVIDKRLPV